MSAARGAALDAAGADPQHDGASPPPSPDPAVPARPDRSDIVIGRFQRAVVVTVHGELDCPRAAHLGFILADLIDGQGNLSLLVDLHDATATDADRVTVLAEAAERARRRGGAVTLSQPPALLHEALRNLGLDHLVGTPDSGPAGTPDPSAAALPSTRQ